MSSQVEFGLNHADHLIR